MAAGDDRHRHLADRRRDPRHPASACRPFSAPGAGVAGEGAGRRLGGAGRGRDPRLQRAVAGRQNSEARSPDRRARRRLAGGPLVVQRGGRGAGGGREHDPADLRGRPRDRRDADRFRRRPARADADGRRRNGGAGAQRADYRGRQASRGARSPAGSAGRKRGAPSCAARCARCRHARICWRSRASGSTMRAQHCPARCGRPRTCIIAASRRPPRH